MEENNAIYQMMILEHLETTKNIRSVVVNELNKIIATEESLERKNLFQSAVELLELKNLMTVHFDMNKKVN